VGRILAVNRRIYGLEKPKGPSKEKKEMPFKAERRHQYWSADVHHLDVVDEELGESKAYAVTILDNHSRAVVASWVSRPRTSRPSSPCCIGPSRGTAHPRRW
jgi:hypothetical protein